MAAKRQADEAELHTTRPRRSDTKRTKIAPQPDTNSDSSNLSHGSVSEDSALQSSEFSLEEQVTSDSSIASLDEDDGDDDETVGSSSTGSSEEDGSESDSDEVIVTIGGPKKPVMEQSSVLGGAQDLRSRLAAFLPRIEKANGTLGSDDRMERGDGSDDEDDGEQHIEMNLGLGVLEEQNDDEDDESDDESPGEDSEKQQQLASDYLSESKHERSEKTNKDEDVMGKLLGQKGLGKPAGIQEVG